MRIPAAVLLILGALCAPALASDVVIYDLQTTHVRDYKRSVNTTDFQGRLDCLMNPDTSAVRGVPVRHWKKGPGNSVIEMNASEKAAVDAVVSDDLKAAERARIDAGDISMKELLMVLDDLSKDNSVTTGADLKAQLGQANLKARLKKLRGL